LEKLMQRDETKDKTINSRCIWSIGWCLICRGPLYL
jgi:hypothetical protein